MTGNAFHTPAVSVGQPIVRRPFLEVALSVASRPSVRPSRVAADLLEIGKSRNF